VHSCLELRTLYKTSTLCLVAKTVNVMKHKSGTGAAILQLRVPHYRPDHLKACRIFMGGDNPVENIWIKFTP